LKNDLSLFEGLYKIENGKVVILKGFKYINEEKFKEDLQRKIDENKNE